MAETFPGTSIPAAFGQTEEIPHNTDRGSHSASPNLPADGEEAEPSSEPAPEPLPSRPAVTAPIAASGGTFSIRFSSSDEFLEVYRRDIQQGGLFVSTRYPAKMQETVSVELHPPLAYAEPVVIRARVVQRFEPGSDSAGGLNLLAGMGLELMELPALMERLQPIVERLGG
jgi:hypothetical protein